MKKYLILSIFSLLSSFCIAQNYAQKFTASLPNFAIGFNFGTLENYRSHSAFGIYGNYYGFSINADMITDMEDDEPDFYEVLFGYQFPIITNYDKKTSGYALYVTPMIGGAVSDVSYNTVWGGEYVESRERELAYGCMLGLRFGGHAGGQVNVKFSNFGISGGIAFVLGK